jgi:hypothetical protein
VFGNLLRAKYRFDEEAPIQLFGYDFIKSEFVNTYNAQENDLTPQNCGIEILNGVKAIDLSRGFRGPKPTLDKMTHAMYEERPLSALGDSVGKARLLASIDEALESAGAQNVVLYAEKVSGEVEDYLNYAVVKKLPYSLTARVGVMENQVPQYLKKSDGRTETDVNLDFLAKEIPVELHPDTIVSFYQNPTGTKGGSKNYFDANKGQLDSLVRKVVDLKPKRVIFPVHLSYLNDGTELANLIKRSKEVTIEPNWSRAHNTEVWVQLSGFTDVANDRNLKLFNYALALSARRKKLVNSVRDYLISGGHVSSLLGHTMSSGLAVRALKMYCWVRKVTESTKAAALTISAPRPHEEQLSFDEVKKMLPKMALEEEPRRPRTTEETSHRDKRLRSPSVGSGSSGGSQQRIAELPRIPDGKSWTDVVEEE